MNRGGSRRSFSISSRFFRDESAQATIEYVLILSVLVFIAIVVINDLVRPWMTRFGAAMDGALLNQMFKPGTMHRSPFSPPK